MQRHGLKMVKCTRMGCRGERQGKTCQRKGCYFYYQSLSGTGVVHRFKTRCVHKLVNVKAPVAATTVAATTNWWWQFSALVLALKVKNLYLLTL